MKGYCCVSVGLSVGLYIILVFGFIKSLGPRCQRHERVYGREAKCTVCAFLVKSGSGGVDMRVGTRGVSHSKSLRERRCQRAVCMFPGGYYTRCGTDGLHYTCS